MVPPSYRTPSRRAAASVSSLAVAATVLLVGCGQSLEQDLDALRDGGRLSVTDAGRGVPVDGAVDPESLSDAGAGPEASSDAGADEHAPVDAGLATAEDGGEVTITASLTPGLVKAGGQVVLSLMVATTRVALLEIDAVLRSPAGSPVHLAHLTGQRVAPASPLRHEEAVALSPTAEAGGPRTGTPRDSRPTARRRRQTAFPSPSASGPTRRRPRRARAAVAARPPSS